MGKDNHKRPVVFFRVDPEVERKIERLARKEHRGKGNMLTVLVLEALKARENVNAGS